MNELYLPTQELDCLAAVDDEASRVRSELDWLLAAFIAVFDEDLREVLLVQLGDYAAPRYGARPWTLPGGSVNPAESPSDGVAREIREETGLDLDRGSLRLAGWFPRPFLKPHHREQVGELLLLYAGVRHMHEPALRPAPPETMQAMFYPFSLASFLAVPDHGEGEHPLQPLPRHWAYWCRVAQVVLADQTRHPLVHVYRSRESMAVRPWSRVEASRFEVLTVG